MTGRSYLPHPNNVLPMAGQSWAGYWTVITAQIIILFVFYLAANGQLQAWFALLTYSAPSTVGQAGAAGVVSTILNPADNIGSGGAIAGVTNPAAMVNNVLVKPATTVYNSFLNMFGGGSAGP